MKPTADCIELTWNRGTYHEIKKLFLRSHDQIYLHSLKPNYACADCVHQYTHKLTQKCEASYEPNQKM